MKRALLAAALLALVVPLRADETSATPPAVTDPAQVARHFHEVAARPEFADARDSSTHLRLEDLLSAWFQNLGKRIGDFKYASRMPAFESLLMSVLVIFSLAIVAYVVLRLTRGYHAGWREADSSAPERENPRVAENHHGEIARAVQAQDWHTAWLVAWRQFLSRLESRNLVDADRTRTNREYLGQLRRQPLPATSLALLTAMVDAYDRCIYGRVPISEVDWTEFHRKIEEAGLLLHLDDQRASQPGTTA